MIKEITAVQGTKTFVGKCAMIVASPTGKVLSHRPASKVGSKGPVMVVTGSKNTLKVGTDKEVADEKVVQDAKYAPAKAALEAEQARTLIK